MAYERILVIGSPGSGKTTFSLELSKILGVGVTHLDRLFWRDNWVNVSNDEFDSQLSAVLESDSWIIDGNYSRTLDMRLERCDTVFFLDYPAAVSLSGYFCRLLKYRGRSRADMGGYCPERPDFEFMRYILKFNGTHRKELYNKLKSMRGRDVFIFHSRRESARFLDKLKKQKSG